ncbi:hypothetical protein QN277_024977 [Acacia crassicarpa]|uniref:F-box domain-containing protein n=1 Tax=Acacia crassicarpa TaxID=499986 RepID=A0AAE1MPM8_9FABA|nr:hypothetical protein QN277_024977 [Acacia crassicarpa]
MEKSESANKMPRTEAEMRDRISDLPDSLLLHILSFLPAKEAVATSLLSKRWRPLWFSLPTLELHREDFQKFTFFYQFVDKMLNLVDLKAVKKFVFDCEHYRFGEYFRHRKISEWINAVIINKVEHLELHLYRKNNEYELPSNIFTAKNIKVLKLSGVIVGRTLSHVNLSLLQVLHLKFVRFPDFRSLGILLSGCVSLRDLVLSYVFLDGYPRLYDRHLLDIGGLHNLVTVDVPEFLLPLKVFSNATFLRFRRV